jgi:hypothetical protein
LKAVKELDELNDKRRSRLVLLPEGLKNNIKKAYTSDEIHL